MYCWKCGTQIADESVYCAACGTAVQQSAPKQREAAQPSASLPTGTAQEVHKADCASQDAPRSNRGHGTLPSRIEAPDLYAGFWRRAASFLIECLILCVPYAILQAIARSYPPAVLVEILLIWLYYALFESSDLRATPGKLALSLTVVDAQGDRIGFWRATGRFFCRFLSFVTLMIGYFMAGWTRHKQCLHDILADTYIVRKKGLDAALGYGLVGDRHPRSATASVVIGLGCFIVIGGLSAVGTFGYMSHVARSQSGEAVSKTASLPIRYAPATRPSDPNDFKGWQAYIGSIVKANRGSIINSPYAYFVPTAADPANTAAVARVQDQINDVVAATLLPGNMIAAAGPSSATTAHVLESAFRNAAPGSFQGVVILFIGDQADEAPVRAAVIPSGATFKFAQM